MAIRKLVLIASVVCVALGGATQTATAFDPDKVFSENEAPSSILRYGFDALKAGRTTDAIGAFRHGADKNHLASQWKLARMLQAGEGAPRDQWAAYQLFQKISDRFAEIPPNRHDRPYVSNSVVALGLYSLSGIEGTPIVRDPFLAEYHFTRAAAIYGDAEAQFQLGVLYNSEQLGRPQPRNAARWFGLASRKGHALAQAELGNMLFRGHGVRKNRVKGLVYLTKAATRSAKRGVKRILFLRESAFASANEAQRNAAYRTIGKSQSVTASGGANPSNPISILGVQPRPAVNHEE